MDLRKHSRLLGKELNNLLADIEKGIGIETSELPPKQLMPIGARFLLNESGTIKEYIKLNDGEYHLLGGGGSGTDAREIELQKSSTHIQWRYEGETTWTDLVALSEITGPIGATGAAGTNGIDGEQGEPGEAGQGIDHISFTSSTGTGRGEQGETDTYTIWGDAGETISLGTFDVYNPLDGSEGLTDAPSDGKTYGRKDAAWVEVTGGESSPYLYLPDFIEVDASNILTIHPERVVWNNASNQTYYLYKDFGANYFDADFRIDFTFYWASVTANSSVNYMIMLTRDVNTYANLVSGSKDFLSVFFNKTVGGTLTLGIREVNGGSLTTSTDTTLTTNTFYFATLDRDESVGTYGQLRLRVYSDYTRSNLLATLTVTLTEKQDFQYMELSVTGGAAGASYGFVEDVIVVSA
jgi:hypothetical protein